jgi:hypothetical protein
MEIKQLLQRSDVINLALQYSLNNNYINPECYKTQTRQLDEVVDKLKKLKNIKSADLSEEYKNKRIMSIKCPLTKKEIIIPSRSIFCEHLDCINFSDMLTHISLVKLVFL